MLNVQRRGLHFHDWVCTLPPITRDLTDFEWRAEQALLMRAALRDFIACAHDDLRRAPEFEHRLTKFWGDLMCDFQLRLDQFQRQQARCDENCLLRKTTLCLSDAHSLYACWMHGTVHKCHGKYTSCNLFYTTPDTYSDTCILSGAHLGYARIAHSDSTFNNQRSTDLGTHGASNSGYRQSCEEMRMVRDSFSVLDVEHKAKAHDAIENSMVNELRKGKEHVYAELLYDVHRSAQAAATSAPSNEPSLADRLRAQRKAREEKAANDKKRIEDEEKARTKVPAAATDADEMTMDKLMSEFNVLVSKENASNKRAGAEEAAQKRDEAERIKKHRMSQSQHQKYRRIGEAYARGVVLQVFNDLLDVKARENYNTYVTNVHYATEKRIIDAYFQNVQRERTLPNLMHLLTLIANKLAAVVEITTDFERPTQAVDRYTKLITELWKVCWDSPHVKQRMSASTSSPAAKRRRSRSGSKPVSGSSGDEPSASEEAEKEEEIAIAAEFSHTPTSTGMATLRQLALGILYALRHGVHIDVQQSVFAPHSVCIVAANEAIALLLPPRDKIYYFGATAQRALQRRLARAFYGPTLFNPLEDFDVLETEAKAKEARADTAQTLLMSRMSNGVLNAAQNGNSNSAKRRTPRFRVRSDLSSTSNANSTVNLALASALLGGEGVQDASARVSARARSVRSASALQSAELASELRSSHQAELGSAKSRKRSRNASAANKVDLDVLAENAKELHTNASRENYNRAMTENRALPVRWKEPFLTGPKTTSTALVYTERDIDEGLAFLRNCMLSYGPQIVEKLNKWSI